MQSSQDLAKQARSVGVHVRDSRLSSSAQAIAQSIGRLIGRAASLPLRVLLVASLCVLFPADSRAQAGPIEVADGDVAGLTAAIQTLNANGGGYIDLAQDGFYSVTEPSDWWFGPNAFPAIASAITINGNGATIERAPGSPNFRFFYISGGFTTLPAGNLTLNNLTLSGGLAQGGTGGLSGDRTGGGGAGMGGAIYNQGTTTLVQVTFTGNTAKGGSAPPPCSTVCNNAGGPDDGGGGGGLGGSGGSSGGGGGGFRYDGGSPSSYYNGNNSAGGGFLGSEGGSPNTGGVSTVGGNGGAGGDSGGGGGGYVYGTTGGSGASTNAGGAGSFGGGNGAGFHNYPASDTGCTSGGGGAFGGGGGTDASCATDGFGGGGGVGGGGGAAFAGGGNGGYGGGGAGTDEGNYAGNGGFGGGGGASIVFPGSGGWGGAGGGIFQGGGAAGLGGAVFNQLGTLVALDSNFTDNAANGGHDSGNGGSGLGGAIFNLNGTVTLGDGALSGNTSSSNSGTVVYNLSHNGGNTLSTQTSTATFNNADESLASPATGEIVNTQVNGTAKVNDLSEPLIAVTPAHLIFNGYLTESIQQTVNVANAGTAALGISHIGVPTGTGITITGNNCPGSLGIGSSCQVQLAFAPAATGTGSTQLTITSNSSIGASTSVLLTTSASAPLTETGLAFSIAPPSTGWVGSAVGIVQLEEETTGAVLDPAGQDTINLTISGPNGFSQSYAVNAVGGLATFQLSGLQFSSPGTYTYSAQIGTSALTASATETVSQAQAGQSAGISDVSIVIAQAETLGSIPVLTQGAPNLDFTLASGGSCTIGTTYAVGQICTVNVKFSPSSAGLRAGAAVLYSADGTVMGTSYIGTNAQGPQITYSSMSSQGIGSGWTSPYSIAVDGASNVYAADNNNVFKVTYSDASYGTPEGIASTGDLTALAVDAAGNVFFSDAIKGVFELPWNGTNYGPATAISNGIGAWGAPFGLAVDGAGDLFVLDNTNDQVVEVPRTGTGYGAGVVIGQDYFINPIGLAVDGADNVYVADSGYTNISGYAAVYQFLKTGSGWSGPNTIGSGYSNNLKSVSVDATGDLYVSDEGAGTVVRFPLTGGGLGNPATILSGEWNAVAVDNLGNLYGAPYLSQVTKYTVTSPPSFNFPTATPVGQPDTADGPQTVSLFNIGNQPLIFSTPATSSNPSYPANFPENTSDTNLCASGTPLAQGTTCDVSVNFLPIGGPNTASVVLTDNALNQASATQSIALSGAVIQATPTINWATPAPILSSMPLSAAQLNATASVAGTFVYTPALGALLSAGAQTLSVTFTPTDTIDYTSATSTVTLQVNQAAAPLTPTQGSTLSGPDVTFSWTAGVGATEYQFWLGTTGVASNNLCSSGPITATFLARTNMPTNGATIYARLYTMINGTWYHTDYTYIAASQAVLSSPASGSTIQGPSSTFGWSAGAGATGYQLWLGSTGVGSNNLYSSGQTTATSLAVTNLPVNGETIYARLYTYFFASVEHYDYTLTAATQAALTSPAPSSTLSGPSSTFTWTAAAGATAYQLWIGSTGAGSNNIYSSGSMIATTVTRTNLPTNGETLYMRLFTDFNGTWTSVNYVYTAAAQGVLTAPAPTSTLAGPSVTFSWAAGTGVTGYQLWLGSTGVNTNNLYSSGVITATSYTAPNLPCLGETVYARLYTELNGTWVHADYTYTAATQAALTSPAPSSTIPGPSSTFTWSAAAGATGYQLWLGSTGVNSNNLYSSGVKTGTSAAVSNLPVNGETIYARLYTELNGAWAHADYTYTSATQAALLSPAPGSTLLGPTSTFTWTPGTGASGYQLWLGSTGAGSNNLYSSGVVTATSAAITLPTNGETVYARLYTELNGTWVHQDYTLTAAAQSVMMSPAPGSTLSGASVTFNWSTATGGATQYQFWLGTTGVASNNLYSSGATTATSVTRTNLPTNGETIYARLYTNYNGTWVHTDYTLTAAP